jgi:hypothetical protein
MYDVAPHRTLHLPDQALERGDIARGCRHHICGIWSVHVSAPRASDCIFIQRLGSILLLLVDVSDESSLRQTSPPEVSFTAQIS